MTYAERTKKRFFDSVRASGALLVLWAATVAICVMCPADALRAQRPDDDYADALELKSARIRFEDAKARFERATALHDQEIISKEQLREEETRFLLARVELDKTYLDVIRRRPRIVIGSAVKYQTDDGRKRVRLSLVYHSSGTGELPTSGLDSPGLAEMARLEEVTDVVISLKTAAGYREGILLESTIISDPYEFRIPVMKNDEAVEVDIGLLVEDVDEVVVSIDYSGRAEQKQILLHKDSGSRPVSLAASQTSLVADLGGEAVYDLTIERFTSGTESYRLETMDLPAGVLVELTDPQSQTRLQRVYFSQDVTTRQVQLKMTIPERPTDEIKPDRALSFSVAVLPRSSNVSDVAALPRDEIVRLGGETLVLELVPRGVGRLEVDAVNLYHEIVRGEAARFEVTVRNVGSLRLNRIEVASDVPYRWRRVAEPDSTPTLSAGEEEIMEMTLEPPDDVALGEYEVRIWLEAVGGSRSVKSEPKTIRAHVRAPARFLGKAALLGLLVLILFVMVFYGIRFSRR